MKTAKMNRRALLMSVISLILCCTMLIGTTMAWFTDSVSSANNKIVAGNLDVKLDYMNDETNGKWEEVTAATNIFKADTLWEPGHVEVVKLQITNVGSLALKYRFQVVPVSEVAGKNVDGKDFKLSDHIRYALIDADKAGSRESALAAVENSYAISENGLQMSSDVTELLKANKSVTTALVVWMPETVGNEANYREGNVPTINLGLNLFATQEMYEADSFGTDYDKNAEMSNFIVTNEEELVAALAEANNGDVIGIRGNVTWTTGAGIGSTPFAEAAAGLGTITFVGVEPNATFTAIGSGVGAIGIDGGTVTFKDLTIADKSVSYAENNWEYGYLEFRGNTVFQNCDIVNAIMMEGESASFIGCSFNSSKDSEYAVWVSEGNASFENCYFTGSRGVKVHEAYGSEVGTVVINGNTFAELSKKPALAIGDVNSETTITLTNNMIVGTQAGDQGNYKYETDTDVATFKFTDENNTVPSGEGQIAGLYQTADGTYYATTSDGLEKGIESVVKDGGTIVLQADAKISGNSNNLTLGTKGATASEDIVLDLNGNTLSTEGGWGGILAYDGAVIKNGTINHTGSVAGVKAYSGSVIENVTVNVTPKEGKTIGGIVVQEGHSVESIKNVTITGATNGIEVMYKGSVGTIENVKVDATKNGLLIAGAQVGNIKNSTIKGGECGVWGQLKGVSDWSAAFAADVTVTGGNYGLYLCDEGANITPAAKAILQYAEGTTFKGGVKDMELNFAHPEYLIVNGKDASDNA